MSVFIPVKGGIKFVRRIIIWLWWRYLFSLRITYLRFLGLENLNQSWNGSRIFQQRLESKFGLSNGLRVWLGQRIQKLGHLSSIGRHDDGLLAPFFNPFQAVLKAGKDQTVTTADSMSKGSVCGD
jgi:hypothetical protein